MRDFELISDFKPTGDQPNAIEELTNGILNDEKFQTLLGVTGSGKTFTIANVIEKTKRPTLVLSHNKTLAAQLYSEFKQFFPNNAVEYFVSYYDYYQPEAYLPATDLYIEKDLAINEEIEKFRLRATSSLLSGRDDVIVVSSVSCIYGIGNPEDFKSHVIEINNGDKISIKFFLNALVESFYSRNDIDFKHGTFRLRGDTLDVFPAYAEEAYRFIFFGDEIESISIINPITGQSIEKINYARIYPASIFNTSKEKMDRALKEIYTDLGAQVDFLKEMGKHIEAKRLEDRVNYDLEMMKDLGYCPGIENYSRYFDRRRPGTRPFCLIDYFPDDFLMVIDESHVTVPQVRGMNGADRSRKQILVDYGFRMPSAMDNRPLSFAEFESMLNQTIFVSATPDKYELMKCDGVVVEQIIRPTGIPDPEVFVRPSNNQVDDLLNEIKSQVEKDERTIVTTLTKRMAEELTSYFQNLNIKAKYIHSDVDTLERIEILQELRKGEIHVIVGINLLREGLDLPEVTLVAILDADKEGFLRDERTLIQTAGRAARNINSRVILYAMKITSSMERMLFETKRRREKQLQYNKENDITPSSVNKAVFESFDDTKKRSSNYYVEENAINSLNDPMLPYMSNEAILKRIETLKKEMKKSAKELDFIMAAHYRDEIFALEKIINEKK